MSRESDLADYLVTQLNAAALGFTSERHYTYRQVLKDLDGLTVGIVPVAIDTTIEDRDTDQDEYTLTVFVMDKVESESPTDCDGVNDKAETIHDTLRPLRLFTTNGTIYQRTESKRIGPYDADRLREELVFISAIQVKYLATGIPS